MYYEPILDISTLTGPASRSAHQDKRRCLCCLWNIL